MSALPAFAVPAAANDAAGPAGMVLPSTIARAVWRGTELAHRTTAVCASGWPELDAQLPGGGWPLESIVEVLTTQPAVLEWRLLAPALRLLVDAGGQIVVVGPPRHPHLPGLQQVGLDERRLVWIQAELPNERLWTTEQLIKSNAAGAIVAWLPKARPEQLRRLQVAAQTCQGLVFLCRPEAARHEASAAPLRVHASAGLDWTLTVQILKRRGAAHAEPLNLPSIPGGLAAVLTPRLRRPSRLLSREASHVVGSPLAPARSEQHATA